MPRNSPPVGDLETGRPIPVRRFGRSIAAFVVGVFALQLVIGAMTNERMQWDVFGRYFFNPNVMVGLWHTIELTIVSMVIGAALGIVIALMRISTNPVLVSVAWGYTWIFRSIPGIVQLLFWYYLAALLPTIPVGIPFLPPFVELDSNALINQFTAAILGLALNEAAYMSEIVRAGIASIDTGQSEAATALGMSRRHIYQKVILPQAMRTIIPPTGNEVINMLKMTSFVIVIAYTDLLTSVSLIYARTFETIPLLMVACVWYLILTSILSVGQWFLENHFSQGFRGSAKSPTALFGRFGRSPSIPLVTANAKLSEPK